MSTILGSQPLTETWKRAAKGTNLWSGNDRPSFSLKSATALSSMTQTMLVLVHPITCSSCRLMKLPGAFSARGRMMKLFWAPSKQSSSLMTVTQLFTIAVCISLHKSRSSLAIILLQVPKQKKALLLVLRQTTPLERSSGVLAAQASTSRRSSKLIVVFAAAPGTL